MVRLVEMNAKMIMKLCCLALSLIVCQHVSGADKVNYRVLNSWERGSYTLHQECTNTLVTIIDNKEVERDESRLLFTWKIEAMDESNDGRQTLVLRMLRIMMRLRCDGKELFYFDSSNGKDRSDLLNVVFSNMKNSTINVDMKNGIPEKVTGCERFWKDIPDPQNDEELFLFSSIKNLATNENIKDTFNTLVCLDASEEVGVGDDWKTHTTLPIPIIGDKSFEWDCSLKSVTESNGVDVAQVHGKGKLDFEIEEQRLKGHVNMEADAEYDTKHGFAPSIHSKVIVSVNKKVDSDGKTHLETYSGLTKNNLTVVKH